jgi:hypothetical protein
VLAATLPEALPVSEVTELCHGLRQRGMHVGAIVANQVPPNPFTVEERAALDAHLPHEVLGRRALVRMEKATEALEKLMAVGAPVLRVLTHPTSGARLVDDATACLVGGGA